MSRQTGPLYGTIRTSLDYWPSYVDILTIVLMVFILQGFLQTFINADYLEVIQLRESQEHLRAALGKEFHAEAEKGTINFTVSPNMLRIRFSEDILFERGRYDLAPAGAEILRRCSRVLLLEGAPLYDQIEVEGHTDNARLEKQTYPHNNWELSSARALTVVRQMIESGVEPKKLSANGYGEFQPIADNTDALAQHRNRRIELRIIFSASNSSSERAP